MRKRHLPQHMDDKFDLLIEVSSEIIRSAARCRRGGLTRDNPVKPGLSNINDLWRRVRDLDQTLGAILPEVEHLLTKDNGGTYGADQDETRRGVEGSESECENYPSVSEETSSDVSAR